MMDTKNIIKPSNTNPGESSKSPYTLKTPPTKASVLYRTAKTNDLLFFIFTFLVYRARHF